MRSGEKPPSRVGSLVDGQRFETLLTNRHGLVLDAMAGGGVACLLWPMGEALPMSNPNEAVDVILHPDVRVRVL